MSLAIEERMENLQKIPIILDGVSGRLEDLGNQAYKIIVKSLDENGLDIDLGCKTKRGIEFQLLSLYISDNETLKALGYEIHVKSLKQGEIKNGA